MMRAGRLRDKAKVQVRNAGQDGMGQVVEAHTDLVTVRCSVEPLNGREYFSSRGENLEVTTRVRMRYRSELVNFGPGDRLEISGEIYDVDAVINVGNRKRELVVMCAKT